MHTAAGRAAARPEAIRYSHHVHQPDLGADDDAGRESLEENAVEAGARSAGQCQRPVHGAVGVPKAKAVADVFG